MLRVGVYILFPQVCRGLIMGPHAHYSREHLLYTNGVGVFFLLCSFYRFS